jgi:hypothetical protein
MRDLPADVKVGKEVVDGLGENARPIDGVDGTEMVFLVEGLVCEQRLYNILRNYNNLRDDCPLSIARKTYLARIKSTLYGDVAHVRVCDGRHLRFLHG